jgi:uncharacterized protein YcbK (DUF882 family)
MGRRQMLDVLERRTLLRAAIAGGIAAVAAPAFAWATEPRSAVRRLALQNLHTGETFKNVYYENGAYVPDALSEASRVLRDWRTGEIHRIEPGLLDTLDALQNRLEAQQPFQVISGYRSPRTNAALHVRSSGVATGSLHMVGQAVDIRIAGVELRNLHKAALSLSAGGVGYYPQSDFVHVDIGRRRQWTGA